MNVLKGFTYCVTASADTTVTDENGLNLAVKAGEQGFFVATGDEVTVTGTCIIVQVRGNFNVPTTSGGGGGQMDYFVLTDAEQQPYKFYANLDNLEYITDDLPQGWFKGNTSLTEWKVPLPNLKAGYGMFEGCTGLTNWTIPLSSLTDGTRMFKGCTGLTGAVSKLLLNKVKNGTSMFEGCTSITSCINDLNLLEDGTDMFKGCTRLKAASNVAFSALVTAPGMFSGCKLDNRTVATIGTKIKNWKDGGTHEITLGVDSAEVSQTLQNNINTMLVGKGWTVTWERN